MCKPISEAVKVALEKPRPLYLSIQILTDDEADLPNWMSPSGCFAAGMCYDPDERAWKSKWDWPDGINVSFRAASAKVKYEEGSRADAAAALRAIAEELDPDVQAKALEIAVAHLVELDQCPSPSADDAGQPCGVADSADLTERDECAACWRDWLLDQAAQTEEDK